MIRKVLINIFIAILIGYISWCCFYTYDINKATTHLRENSLSRSHNCCAWFVMRAMQKGGFPSIILPAWAYKYYLPINGWKEINDSNYIPVEGDVVVFPFVKGHPYGHIAMWDGSQWISDFKQKGIIVSKDYSNYKIYRNKRVKYE